MPDDVGNDKLQNYNANYLHENVPDSSALTRKAGYSLRKQSIH